MEGEAGVPEAPRSGSVPAAGRSPIAGAPSQRLVYDGRRGELYRIFIVNILLSLVTLGIYRFWGKTRMRRYLWSHLSYDGDRLEYTGTGGELFKGFLMVAAVLILLGLANAGAQFAVEILVRDGSTAMVLLFGFTFIFYVVLFFLLYLGQYTALRYRLTRTSWRGIRGGLAGSAWRYGLMAMGYTILRILTLGQYTPFAAVRLWRYRIGNACFGTAPARFEGSGRQVYKPFLLSFLAAVTAAAIAYGGALALSPDIRSMLQTTVEHYIGYGVGASDNHVQGVGAEETGTDPRGPRGGEPAPDDADSGFSVLRFVGLVLLLGLPVSLVALIAHCWYWTKLLALMAHGTAVAGLAFRTAPTTGQLWWLLAGNALISLFTLGLGHPIVLQRLWRFVARHLELVGTIDGSVIAQSRLAAPSRGEGLLEALDPGVF